MAKPVEIEILLKDRLSAGLETARRELERLSAAGDTSSDRFRQLQADIRNLEAELERLDGAAGNTRVLPAGLPQAQRQFNGLHNSIQQMAREMPSLAMGPQMFFLAISNNLPIFTDELARARKEYQALTAAGQKATPVWRQVLSSLFSWQTALTTGIMLLVMYGDEIVDWAKKLLTGEDAADRLKKQMLELNETEKDAVATQIRTRAELDATIGSIRDFNGTREQERQKIEELNSRYGSIFGRYETLAQWYDILVRKGDDYIASLFAQAKAQSYIQKAIEADRKARDIRANGIEEYRPFWGRGGKLHMFFGGSNTRLGSDPARLAYEEALRQAEQERDEALENARELQRDDTRATQEAGLFDYRSLASGGGKQAADQLKSYLDELAQLRQDNEDRQVELMAEGTDKQLAEIDLRYRRIRDKVKELEANLSAQQGGNLTPEQQGTFLAAYNGIDAQEQAERDTLTQKQLQADEQAMNEYYQKYGTFLQKREALEKEYRQKIAEAGGADTWKGKALQKEFEEAAGNLNMEELKEKINWEQVFGDLDSLSADGLQRVKEQLKEFINAQKDLSPESIKEIVDALERIDDEQAERNPFGSLAESLSTLDEATRRVHEAQQEYNRALKEGTEEEIKNAKAALAAARDDKQEAKAKATDALHAATAEAQKYVAVAGGLTDIVSQLGIEPPEWLEGYLSGADKALQGLSEIELTKPMTIITGGLKAASGMIQQITSLGGLINWNGSNAQEVRDTIERLTERNEALQGSIDALNDTIKQGRGTQSVQAAQQAKQYQEEVNRNYLEMAKAQAGYHGKRHSWNYYWEGFSQEQINRLSEQIGRQWSGNLWELSPEEMQRLKGNVDMWEQIGNTGKGGYGHRLQEQLDQYISQAGQLEEITDSLYESLTQISFDSMYDSFVDSLMDMEYSAEDAAENISEYFMRAMLSNKIGELYYDKLEDWWEKFGQAMENDGTLDETERENLTDEYMGYVDDALKLRDQLAAATGYTGSSSGTGQTGRAGSFNAMSQEQGTKLEGLFTSGQMHWASMDSLMQDAVTQMGTAIDRLRNIEEHTGDSARHLAEIKEDIKRMIRDGVKMK